MCNIYDFKPVSSKQWKNSIQYLLNGESFDSITKKTSDGIVIKPFYHLDENKKLLDFYNVSDFCNLNFPIFVGQQFVKTPLEIPTNLKSISWYTNINNTDFFPIHNLLTKNCTHIIYLKNYTEKNTEYFYENIYKSNIYLAFDPIFHFAKNGTFYNNYKTDFKIIIDNYKKKTEDFTLFIDCSLYANAGSSDVEQIAFSLAHINEYLQKIENFEGKILIKWALGTDFWLETAKFKSFELLLKEICLQYSEKISIDFIATTCKRFFSTFHNQWNEFLLLQSIFIAKSIGIKHLEINPIDLKNQFSLDKNFTEFSQWEKLNRDLILPKELSFSTEIIGAEFTEKALKLFKKIERNDGFIAQLIKGNIQKSIQKSEKQSSIYFFNQNNVFLKNYKNTLKNIDLKPFMEKFISIKNIRKTKITPIIEKRLLAKFEKNILSQNKK